MASLLQLKIQLVITQKLYYFAVQSGNLNRMIELANVRSILKDTIIEALEHKNAYAKNNVVKFAKVL